ncbi:MAG: TIM barrel protein [Actinomycetota bacterium]
MLTGAVAVTTNAYSGYALEVALDHVGELDGCDAVELDAIDGLFTHIDPAAITSPAYRTEVLSMLADRQLRCTAISAQRPSIVEMDDTYRPTFEGKLLLAAELGASRVNVGSGPIGSEAAFLDRIRALLPVLDELQLTLGIETQTPSALVHDRIGAELVKRIASARVDLNYDFGNDYFATDGHLDLAADVEASIASIGSVHLKDAVRDAGGWRWTSITGNVVDYAAVFALLRAAPHEIAVAIELPQRMIPGTADLRPEIPSLETIDEMLAESIDNVRRW